MWCESSRKNAAAEFVGDDQITLDAFTSSSEPRDWFELIRPYIKYHRKNTTSDELRRVAKIHARQVVSKTDLNIDLDRIVWRASARMDESHGTYSTDRRRPVITLSMLSLQTNGWEKMMKTVRHELVHAWQVEHDLWKSKDGGDIHDCPSFERWMNVLDIRKTGPEVTDSRYVIECEKCGRVETRRKVCIKIRKIVRSNPCCVSCGADWKHLQVYDLEHERPLEREDLPKEPLFRIQLRFRIGEDTRLQMNCTGELSRYVHQLLQAVERWAEIR